MAESFPIVCGPIAESVARVEYRAILDRAAKFYGEKPHSFNDSVRARMPETMKFMREHCGIKGAAPTPADWLRTAQEVYEDIREGWCDSQATLRQEGNWRDEY